VTTIREWLFTKPRDLTLAWEAGGTVENPDVANTVTVQEVFDNMEEWELPIEHGVVIGDVWQSMDSSVRLRPITSDEYDRDQRYIRRVRRLNALRRVLGRRK
jgi:hypothetical protein